MPHDMILLCIFVDLEFMTRNIEYLIPSVNLSLAKKYMKTHLFFMLFILFYFNFILLYKNKITNDTR